MTDFETIARLRGNVIDFRKPVRRVANFAVSVGIAAGIVAGVIFLLFVGWAFVAFMFSL